MEDGAEVAEFLNLATFGSAHYCQCAEKIYNYDRTLKSEQEKSTIRVCMVMSICKATDQVVVVEVSFANKDSLGGVSLAKKLTMYTT